MELKIKIWDFNLNSFAVNPMEYIEFNSYNTINNQIHIFPIIKSNLKAELFHCIDKQDINGIDIYEGERILFFNLITGVDLIQSVTRKGILSHWTLGEYSFDDAVNMRIIGHKYDNSPLRSMLDLL